MCLSVCACVYLCVCIYVVCGCVFECVWLCVSVFDFFVVLLFNSNFKTWQYFVWFKEGYPATLLFNNQQEIKTKTLRFRPGL